MFYKARKRLTTVQESFTFFLSVCKKSIGKGSKMDSVYKVIELVGTSPKSFEEAARNAVETASKSLQDIRIAEVTEFDMKVEDGKVVSFRAKVKISFKYKD
jgi:flavin-binding protein dodecin